MRTGILFAALAVVSMAPLAASVAPADAAAPTPSGADPGAPPIREAGIACTTASLETSQEALPASLGGITAQSCRVEVDCESKTIFCEGGSCEGQDRDCSVGNRGYVECDGDRDYCPNSCCPCGPCGSTRLSDTGLCCGNNLKLWDIQTCTLSGWQDTGDTTCLVECDDGTKP